MRRYLNEGITEYLTLQTLGKILERKDAFSEKIIAEINRRYYEGRPERRIEEAVLGVKTLLEKWQVLVERRRYVEEYFFAQILVEKLGKDLVRQAYLERNAGLLQEELGLERFGYLEKIIFYLDRLLNRDNPFYAVITKDDSRDIIKEVILLRAYDLRHYWSLLQIFSILEDQLLMHIGFDKPFVEEFVETKIGSGEVWEATVYICKQIRKEFRDNSLLKKWIEGLLEEKISRESIISELETKIIDAFAAWEEARRGG